MDRHLDFEIEWKGKSIEIRYIQPGVSNLYLKNIYLLILYKKKEWTYKSSQTKP